MNCPHCGKITDATAYRIAKKDRACRACRNIAAREWRARRKASGNPVVSSKTWAPEKRDAWWKKNASDQRQKNAKRMRGYAKRPDLRAKHEARWKTHRALASGRLVRLPCERCGWPRTQAHHRDYSKPLEVMWPCQPCHRKEHARASGE